MREVPAEAEVISHRLLLRAGFIKKAAAGVYSYLPLGYRVLRKMSQIVREEMNAIGAQEVYLPVLVPIELLEETERSGVDVLMRMKDRNDRDFILGFTHEEIITDIVRSYVQSWKQLPLSLYQIQTKFRDEPRPRAGLLRGREFLMKDSYSFDNDDESFMRSYNAHSEAYNRIFRRFGLAFLSVDADPGDIGGSESREFMILAESGEDTVLLCDSCGYAANAERAEIGVDGGRMTDDVRSKTQSHKSKIVSTPGAHTVAQVCEYLGVGPERLIKTIIADVDGETLAALVRGDRELNLPKLGRLLGGKASMADAPTIERVTTAPVGFAGPVGLEGIRIIADNELMGATDMVVGANQDDAHRVDVAPGVDFPVTQWGDLRVAIAGDRCSQCSGTYRDAHGIEVGHIFQLGTKYSHSMQAQVTGEDGEMRDVVMGCYGLGVSRTMAAAIEALHDDDGIIWPITIAPYQVVIVVVNGKDETQRAAAERLYTVLTDAGVEVMLDDRDERTGVKFKDADLIGYPIRIVVGRAVAEGTVEVVLRRAKGEVRPTPLTEAVNAIQDIIRGETERLSGDG
jgi:prolyl-tRNA synthetase